MRLSTVNSRESFFDQLTEKNIALSPMQIDLLFCTLCDSTMTTGLVQYIFKIEGNLNISTLQYSLQQVIEIHPILRTAFDWESYDIPIERVEETSEISFKVEDWKNLPQIEKTQKLDLLIKEDLETAFNLKVAPLLRLSLVCYEANFYYLVCAYQNVLLDKKSFFVIFRDILDIYENNKQNKAAYFELYDSHQAYLNWLQQQNLKEAKTFWKNYLSNLEPSSLIFKHTYRENLLNEYHVCKEVISTEEIDDLKKFAKKNELNLSSIFHGIIGIIFSNFNHNQEVVLGVKSSNVGFVGNILPLRIQWVQGESIISFFKRIQSQVKEIHQYAYVSSYQIKAFVNEVQDLFDIIVNYEEDTFCKYEPIILKDLSITFSQHTENSGYPLSFFIRVGNKLEISVNYQTAYFEEEFIKTLLKRFRLIFKELFDQFNKSPTELFLLTEEEKQKLLVDWINIEGSYPKDSCIHELFENQAKKMPHNTAIIHNGVSITFSELNEKANQLAYYLRDKGIGPKTLVGIYTHTSPDMIVALLAVLKAGGAYVPVDTLYPNDRLNFMFLNAGVKLVITNKDLKENLSSNLSYIYIEEDFSSYSTRDLPCVNASSQDLIYVLYTSGSTGWPKGALLKHQGVSNLLNFYTKEFGMTSSDKVLIVSSFSFDLTQKNILGMLLVGGTICLRSSNYYDPFDIAEDIMNYKVTLLNCTPSGFYPLLEEIYPLSQLDSLKKVFLGGEPIATNRLEPIIDNNLSIEIINTYGPTECSDLCATYRLTKNDIINKKVVPIGKILPNVSLYVFSSNLQLVPIGGIGELYIGGVGVGAGYINAPELTAEKFIDNPFDGENKSKIYKTGDLVRYLPDGNIEFLGRIDDQVKIRGFRIELGEIESSLKEHADVLRTVVVARKDELGTKKLVAYIVLKEELQSNLILESTLVSSSGDKFSVLIGEELSSFSENLCHHLALSLPEYMIPSFFVYLDKIPLTPNSKIDRKSLPNPSSMVADNDYVAPNTHLEIELCSLLCEVLKLEKVSLHDNFFRLGMEPADCFRILNKARQREISLSVDKIFHNPTISSLAKSCKNL